MGKNNYVPPQVAEAWSWSYGNGPENSCGVRLFTGSLSMLASPCPTTAASSSQSGLKPVWDPFIVIALLCGLIHRSEGGSITQGCSYGGEFSMSRAQAGTQLLTERMILPSDQPHRQPMQRKKGNLLCKWPDKFYFPPCSLTGSLLTEILTFQKSLLEENLHLNSAWTANF